MNHELRLKKYNGKSGFTLAEILVVMAITAIVGTILVMIFTNTLRGSNKSQILAVIKQNGQAVLENMDKTIRNADNVVCMPNTYNTEPPSGITLVVVKKGLYTRYRFVPANNSIAATGDCGSLNGCIQQDNPVQSGDFSIGEFLDGVSDGSFNGICSDQDPLVSPVVTLTDTNTQSGVSVENGLFTRDQQSGSKDSVSIQFELGPGVAASEIIRGQVEPVTFQTTIGLR